MHALNIFQQDLYLISFFFFLRRCFWLVEAPGALVPGLESVRGVAAVDGAADGLVHVRGAAL